MEFSPHTCGARELSVFNWVWEMRKGKKKKIRNSANLLNAEHESQIAMAFQWREVMMERREVSLESKWDRSKWVRYETMTDDSVRSEKCLQTLRKSWHVCEVYAV